MAPLSMHDDGNAGKRAAAGNDAAVDALFPYGARAPLLLEIGDVGAGLFDLLAGHAPGQKQ